MATTKVSLSECNACRLEQMATSSLPVFSRPKKQEYSNRDFVEKLSNKEIAEFFSKLGYVNHTVDYSSGKAVLVVECKDFDVMTDGFTTAFSYHANNEKDSSGFSLVNLQKYAEATGTSAETLLINLIETNLFANRFPNYPSKKHDFEKMVQRNASNNFLNRQMQSLFKTPIILQEANQNTKFDYLTSGELSSTYSEQRAYRK